MNNVNGQQKKLRLSPVILLILAGYFFFLKIPGTFLIFTALGLVGFLFTRYKRNLSISLSSFFVHAFFISGLISSFVSLLLFSKVDLLSSFFLPLSSFYLFYIIVSRSPRYPIYPHKIERVMFYSFSIIALIAFIEVLLDANLASTIYPLSPVLPYMEADRFIVSSIFVNFNDFCAAMVMYTLQLIFRFGNETRLTSRGFYLLVLLFVVGICLYIGSRGYLICLATFFVMRFYLSMDLKVKRVRTSLIFFISILLLSSGGAFLLNKYPSYFFDNSNLARVLILINYVDLILADVKLLLFGFGGRLNFQELANIGCSSCIVDPHNLFLEIAIAYGAGAFVSFVLLYVYTSYTFLKNNEYFDRYEKVLTNIFILSLISGAISSSSLRYYYIFFLVVAVPSIISNVKNRKYTTLTFVGAQKDN